jgi:DNA-directed RNA polymerase specialized sigma24 family protein
MTTEDAAAELEIAVVMACRYWARQSEDPPPDKYVNAAIRRRRGKLYQQIAAAIERGNAEDVDEHASIADDNPNPDDAASAKQSQVTAAQWEAVLATILSPQEIALLRLRALGWTNREIAKHIQGDNQDIKRKVYRAKGKARDFLQRIGIDSLDDALDANAPTIQTAWFHAVE